MQRPRPFLASLFFLSAFSAPALAEVRYVDASAVGGANDGTSWANAFRSALGLQNALAVAVSGDQIWTAKGLYKPTRTGDRARSIDLVDGVGVYGGFVGGEATLGERNPALNVTILSGDLAGNDASGAYLENSCHVVRGAPGRLDGFTITGGYSDGSDGTPATGSAIFMDDPQPLTIENCVIRENHGRAVALPGTYMDVADCRFEDNVGGAVETCCSDSGSIRRCVFTGNSAAEGSALLLTGAFDIFIDECLFFGNVTDNGTIAFGLETYPWIQGCTLVANRSTRNSGAGLLAYFGYRGWGGIWNSIFYFNEGADGSQGFDDQVSSGFPIANSCIQGGPTNPGNIAVDPEFVDFAGGDFHLSPTSPCIDAGDNSAVGLTSNLDLDRTPRRQDIVEVGDTGSGTAPIIDMGAFELPSHLYSIVCSGDGSLATACPCGNGGADARGCRNSYWWSGAGLVASGTPHPDTVVLTADGMPPTVLCLFLQGNALLSSGAVFGDGVRCVGGALKRLGSKTTSSTGTASYPTAGDTRIATRSAALGDPIPNGAMRWYQTWYRDSSATFCPPPAGATWNISAGVAITW